MHVSLRERLWNNPEFLPDYVGAIGISYQMHGLVVVDKDLNVLRPSIIWCDSRAVEIGNKAMEAIGEENCFTSFTKFSG